MNLRMHDGTTVEAPLDIPDQTDAVKCPVCGNVYDGADYWEGVRSPREEAEIAYEDHFTTEHQQPDAPHLVHAHGEQTLCGLPIKGVVIEVSVGGDAPGRECCEMCWMALWTERMEAAEAVVRS